MKPLVSILIPAYNKQAWLADTIESAIAQTWDRKEIIIVDDGSTDETLAVARRFEGPSVRVWAQKNAGAAAARNTAFALSQGQYIQWLDADDLLAPEKVAAQLEQPNTARTLLSSSWTRFMYRHHRAPFRPDALWGDLSPAEFLLRKLQHNLFMPNAAWLVSRELTERAGPWDPSQQVDDDGEYFCRVLVASDGVRFVPDAKMYYRVADDNTLSDVGRSNPKLDSQWRSVQLHIDYLRSVEDSERVHRACIPFLQVSLNYFYPERPDLVARAHQMARTLGGELGVPRLSWKYSWIARTFGWGAARRVQRILPRIRWSLTREWDKALFRMSNTAGRLGGKSTSAGPAVQRFTASR